MLLENTANTLSLTIPKPNCGYGLIVIESNNQRIKLITDLFVSVRNFDGNEIWLAELASKSRFRASQSVFMYAVT